MAQNQNSPRRHARVDESILPTVKQRSAHRSKSDFVAGGVADDAADTLPDDWFDFKPETSAAPEVEAEAAALDLDGGQTLDLGDASWEAGAARSDAPTEAVTEFIPGGSAEEVAVTHGEITSTDVQDAAALGAPIKTDKSNAAGRGNGKRIGLIIGIIALCAIVVAVAAFFLTQGKAAQPEKEETLVVEGTGHKIGDDVGATITVQAEGYNNMATPIVYHVTGKPTDTQQAEVDRYGFVSPVSETTRGKSVEQLPEGTFEAVVDALPAGSYTLSWSSAILEDGSYYTVPEDQAFTIGTKNVKLTATFTKVSGATAAASDVKKTYENLAKWLGSASGEVAQQSEAILQLAKANAEKAAAVAAAGGLDEVGKASASAASASTESAAPAATTTTTTTTTTDTTTYTPTYVEPTTTTDTTPTTPAETTPTVEPEPAPAPAETDNYSYDPEPIDSGYSDPEPIDGGGDGGSSAGAPAAE